MKALSSRLASLLRPLLFAVFTTNFMAATKAAPFPQDPCPAMVEVAPQQESRSAHAIPSELEGRWVPVRIRWAAGSTRGVAVSPTGSLLEGAQTLHIARDCILRADEHGAAQITVIDDPKFVSRPPMVAGETVAWWEQRTLVIKQVSSDGLGFTLERYVPVDTETVELTRRRVVTGAPVRNTVERLFLQRQHSMKP